MGGLVLLVTLLVPGRDGSQWIWGAVWLVVTLEGKGLQNLVSFGGKRCKAELGAQVGNRSRLPHVPLSPVGL